MDSIYLLVNARGKVWKGDYTCHIKYGGLSIDECNIEIPIKIFDSIAWWSCRVFWIAILDLADKGKQYVKECFLAEGSASSNS